MAARAGQAELQVSRGHSAVHALESKASRRQLLIRPIAVSRVGIECRPRMRSPILVGELLVVRVLIEGRSRGRGNVGSQHLVLARLGPPGRAVGEERRPCLVIGRPARGDLFAEAMWTLLAGCALVTHCSTCVDGWSGCSLARCGRGGARRDVRRRGTRFAGTRGSRRLDRLGDCDGLGFGVTGATR